MPSRGGPRVQDATSTDTPLGSSGMSQSDEQSLTSRWARKTFEQGDEALDEQLRLDPDFLEDVERTRRSIRTLLVDDLELEEAGAKFDDPELLATLDGGIDDPDGAIPRERPQRNQRRGRVGPRRLRKSSSEAWAWSGLLLVVAAEALAHGREDLVAKSSSPREEKREYRDAVSTGAGTPSSSRDRRPPPLARIRHAALELTELGESNRAAAVRSSSHDSITLPRRQTSATPWCRCRTGRTPALRAAAGLGISGCGGNLAGVGVVQNIEPLGVRAIRPYSIRCGPF